jgi:multidrug efflux pump subunit AcrB
MQADDTRPPEDEASSKPDRKGPLAWMTLHPVASNLFMFVLLIGGILGVLRTKQEVFPEFALDMVNVTVPYPGASPAEVEQGIVLAIEEGVRAVDGVKRVTSSSGEGNATVTVELLSDAEANEVLADVKNEVDRIQTFPEEAEEPIVSLAKRRNEVISLVLSGDQDLRTLHDLAETARQRLLKDERISQVDLEGVPPLEISIEVPREDLDAYGFSLQQIAAEVTDASLELPGGALETANGELLVRLADRRLTGHEFEDIILRSTADGAEIRLGDIATIRDGYEDTKQSSFYNGKPAVRLTVFRIGDETPTGVADAVKEIAAQLETELPPEVAIATWNDQSEALRDRIDLLMRNAGMGLALVLVILALFLDLRLAFWVSLGIPISFLGSFLLLGTTDLSINMITLFAFIVTLGMVVDDAIVVGERTYAMMEQGMNRADAAVAAAKEMAGPVTFAILTTAAAFSPLFFVPGIIGKFFSMIPAVVISVLVLSLFESFFVLPAHLAHGKDSKKRLPRRGLIGALARGHASIGKGLEWVTLNVYKPVARVLVRARYITLSVGLATLILTIGFVASGRVPFNFFPILEGDIVTMQARMPYGTSVDTTAEVQRAAEEAARKAIEEVGGEAQVRGMFTYLGQAVPSRGPGPGGGGVGTHLTGIEVQLRPSGDRAFTSAAFAAAWRKHMPPVAGIESLQFSSASGPGAGAAVAVQLSHPDTEVLAVASAEMTEAVRGYPTLKNVSNEYSAGKPRLDYHLRPQARVLGLTGSTVAFQLRSAFYGSEAIREQRGRNEIKVMVRLPKSQRESEADLSRFMLRTPAGGDVPLGYVATFERNTSPTTIRREDGQRQVTVSGELAEGVASATEVLADLQKTAFVELQKKYPQLSISLVGQQREQEEAFASLRQNYVMALFLIFALLALPFRSYLQPLIIMAVIPFGIVGAIAGHALMGYTLSIMSVFGIIALSGVVVNDSLVLIDATNRERAAGKRPMAAVIDAGASRMRPILLTSLTTFFGLIPMIAETSVQARFLIPMAISLGFGVLFVTFVVLLLVPALYMIVEDVRSLFGAGDPGEQLD